MGVSQRAYNEKMRKMLHDPNLKIHNDAKDVMNVPPSRDQVTCKSCGFKATYKFIRCPSCEELAK